VTLIRRGDPFVNLFVVARAMDRLGADVGRGLPLDVRVTPDAVEVDAALPGVKPDDVSVDLEGRRLTISATLAADERSEDGGFVHREIRRGRFSRTLSLPEGLDAAAATAAFEHGLLRLTIPRAEAARPHRIPVTTGAAEQPAEQVPVETPAGQESTTGAA
jgi:HSP20 family protein